MRLAHAKGERMQMSWWRAWRYDLRRPWAAGLPMRTKVSDQPSGLPRPLRSRPYRRRGRQTLVSPDSAQCSPTTCRNWCCMAPEIRFAAHARRAATARELTLPIDDGTWLSGRGRKEGHSSGHPEAIETKGGKRRATHSNHLWQGQSAVLPLLARPRSQATGKEVGVRRLLCVPARHPAMCGPAPG